jgi:putative cell wall-binding protein
VGAFYDTPVATKYPSLASPAAGTTVYVGKGIDSGSIIRVSGETRIGTAVNGSQTAFPDATAVDTVIVAYSGNFPDALAASTLAGVTGAPILLSDRDSLNAETATEIVRLNPGTVYITGGVGAISQKVEDAIKALAGSPKVTRLGGATRFETAGLVAAEAVRLGAVTDEIFLVNGGNFPDALSVGSFAASQHIPVLLTTNKGLDPIASKFITTNNVDDVVIAGGASAVWDGTEAALTKLGVGSVIRYGGATRYETADLAITALAVKYGISNPTLVGVASGDNFPDALAGAASIGNRSGILLITPAKSSGSVLATLAKSSKVAPPQIEVFGGPNAVSEVVFSDLKMLHA